MKKKTILIAAVLLCTVLLQGCFFLQEPGEKHTHTYGDAEYSVDLDGRKTIIKQKCSCGHVSVTREDMSTEDMAEYLKENCKPYTWKELARSPDKYKNELAVLTGEVFQVKESSDGTTLLVSITKVDNEFFPYYTDNVYVEYEFSDELKILEDDIITMYGKLQGEETYISIILTSETRPSIKVYYAELVE